MWGMGRLFTLSGGAEGVVLGEKAGYKAALYDE